MAVSLDEAFARYGPVGEPDACWLWSGSQVKGYGSVKYKDERGWHLGYAHRLAWQRATGQKVPAGMEVCHSCDVPLCVNPAHLWLGSHRDNIHDAIAKGHRSLNQLGKHGRNPRGEKTYNAKLTADAVKLIRAGYAARGIEHRTMSYFAREYGVSMGTIQDVIELRTWRHIQ